MRWFQGSDALSASARTIAVCVCLAGASLVFAELVTTHPANAQTAIACANFNTPPQGPNCYYNVWEDQAGTEQTGAAGPDITLTVPAGTYTGYGTENTGTDTDGVGGIFIIQSAQQGGNGRDGHNDNGGAGGYGGSFQNFQIGSGVSVIGYSQGNSLVTLGLYGGSGGKGTTETPSDNLGGSGGAGGDTGDIGVTIAGTITADPASITAVGLGIYNAGGNGGAAPEGGVLHFAGNGGDGGNSGDINLTFSGSINGPIGGLAAESYGGQGSAGGDDTGGSITKGGDGGDGGTGGNITFTLTADGTITGANAGYVPGVLMLSQGGNGANGGHAAAASSGAQGGNGGNAGAAGSILATLNGSVQTIGNNGVQLQSFGGAGGSGGGADGSNASGGDAGAAANGNTVTVTGSGGLITTQAVVPSPTGDIASVGVLAQSIGGGGGNGGSAGGIFTVGGTGSEAGDGGMVSITLNNTITTNGYQASGIVAQSVGGGGGVGGYADGVSVGIGYVIGGTGGSGGSGSSVSASSAGGILTNGISAHGIFAQSVGGGGGIGGQGTSYQANVQFGISTAIGGDSSGGGDGGAVGTSAAPILNSGLIIASGQDSFGVLGQSIGGGGGNGGGSTDTALTIAPPDDFPTIAFSSSFGGRGGGGGTGGDVYVSNTGVIMIDNDGGAALMAQSVGGGGGNGGDAQAASYVIGTGDTLNASVAHGGNGGGGGDGGVAQATNSSLIMTSGATAMGVVAQSIGGGGGWAGVGNTNATTIGSNSSLSLSIALGGTDVNYGADESAGGTATATNTASGGIATMGDGAYGMLVQSIGGGGGLGGGGGASGNGKLTFSVGVGGSGGFGGSGGTATATNNGSIVTVGADATGMMVQSIGGGGGAGGQSASLAVNDPTTGNGTGGHGQLVQAITTGFGESLPSAIDANGNISPAGQAALQNLAGNVTPSNLLGWAFSGFMLARNIANTDSQDLDVLSTYVGGSVDGSTADSITVGLSIGGAGGSGGAGGTVNATNTGSIYTVGNMAEGIWAMSVGGGGGTAGAASNSTSNSTSWSIPAAVGGAGGLGGGGGAVVVTNSGNILTNGQLSDGIVAQSIGGGGGSGGVSGASGGILRSMPVSIGGNGGTTGDGGTVLVTHSGIIQTQSQGAMGIVAQSIGGGGGIFKGMAIDNDTGGGSSVSQTFFPIDVTFGYSVSSGGSTGGGNTVTVNLDQGAQIQTSGTNAHGVLAQSIGGGGGLITGGQVSGNDFFGVTPMGGNGGDVDVTLTGARIVTGYANLTENATAAGAIGIWAQSIGGGGGTAGDQSGASGASGAIQAFPATSHIPTGSAGDVAVKLHGGSSGTQLMTVGNASHAIFAQSISGGGGHVISDTASYTGSTGGAGTAGAVTVELGTDGTSVIVQAGGDDSAGIWAQSSGHTTGAITVSIGANASVAGGGNSTMGSAIIFDSGTQNVFSNEGTVTSSTFALFSNTGTGNFASLQNSGTMTGSVNITIPTEASLSMLSDVAAAMAAAETPPMTTFFNKTGGVLNTGAIYDLGGSTLDNEGIISIGVDRNFALTTLTGDFVQHDGARLVVDVDHKNSASDLFGIDGDADIAGEVFMRPVTLTPTELAVASVSGSIDTSAAIFVTGSPFFSYSSRIGDASGADANLFSALAEPDAITPPFATVLYVTPDASFPTDDPSLRRTGRAIAEHLQTIWDGDHPEYLADGFAKLAMSGDVETQALLSTLAGPTMNAIGAARLTASTDFVAEMDGCPALLEGSLLPEKTNCFWARALGGTARASDDAVSTGYSANSGTVLFGGQVMIDPDLLLAGSLGYERSGIDGNEDGVSLDGNAVLGAIGLTYLSGPFMVSGTFDFGYGSYDSTRLIDLGQTMVTAEASPEASNVGLHARFAFETPVGDLSLRPQLDLAVNYITTNGYSESGAGDLDLTVASADKVVFSAAPSVELAKRVTLKDGTRLRLFAGLGVDFLSDANWATEARLSAAPASAGTFTSEVENPDVIGRFRAGVDVLASSTMDVKVEYDAAFADGFVAQAGSFRLNYRY